MKNQSVPHPQSLSPREREDRRPVNGDDRLRILEGDVLSCLRTVADESVHCVVTSPPYWGLRDYGVAGQIGLEKSPGDYVEKMVGVFREVRRVLRKDGTCWVNLGDCYAGSRSGSTNGSTLEGTRHNQDEVRRAKVLLRGKGSRNGHEGKHAYKGANGTNPGQQPNRMPISGLKEKDLVMMPARVALALQADGWWLRSKITWCKKVPMPESVTDRPTCATEDVFLLTKCAKYFYDAEAVRNPPSESFVNDSRWGTSVPAPLVDERNGRPESGAQNPKGPHRMFAKQAGVGKRQYTGFNARCSEQEANGAAVRGSNMRNFWVLGPEPFPDAHFATFPTAIPRRAIMAGCPVGGVVLDPFAGSGTTGAVALELGRKAILIELNPMYVELIRARCGAVTPGML